MFSVYLKTAHAYDYCIKYKIVINDQCLIQSEAYLFLNHDSPHINQSIPHPSESCIYAHFCYISYFFKA